MDKCKSMNPGFYRHTEIQNLLIICKIKFSIHGGEYECIASNKIGSVTKRMNLTIEGKHFGNHYANLLTTFNPTMPEHTSSNVKVVHQFLFFNVL